MNGFLTEQVANWPTLHGTAKEEYQRRQGPTGNELGNLVNRTAASWPTPDASEAGKTSRSGDRIDEPLLGGIVRTSWPTSQARDEKGETQNAHRMDAVPNVLKASWPTPDKSAMTRGGIQNPNDAKAQGHSLRLTDYIGAKVWPTPNANDNRDRGSAAYGTGSRRAEDTTKQTMVSMVIPRGQTPFGCLARTISFVERLTTLSTWLMGYTAQYLRHWEIRSYRKSPTKSLKQSQT